MMFGMGFGMLFMVIFWVAIIAVFVGGIGALGGGGYQSRTNTGDQSALDIASQRYARGEISREEYDLLKKDLKVG